MWDSFGQYSRGNGLPGSIFGHDLASVGIVILQSPASLYRTMHHDRTGRTGLVLEGRNHDAKPAFFRR
jgi:hypothetical protein